MYWLDYISKVHSPIYAESYCTRVKVIRYYLLRTPLILSKNTHKIYSTEISESSS